MITAIPTTSAPVDSTSRFNSAEIAAGSQDVVHQQHLLARLLFQILAECAWDRALLLRSAQ